MAFYGWPTQLGQPPAVEYVKPEEEAVFAPAWEVTEAPVVRVKVQLQWDCCQSVETAGNFTFPNTNKKTWGKEQSVNSSPDSSQSTPRCLRRLEISTLAPPHPLIHLEGPTQDQYTCCNKAQHHKSPPDPTSDTCEPKPAAAMFDFGPGGASYPEVKSVTLDTKPLPKPTVVDMTRTMSGVQPLIVCTMRGGKGGQAASGTPPSWNGSDKVSADCPQQPTSKPTLFYSSSDDSDNDTEDEEEDVSLDDEEVLLWGSKGVQGKEGGHTRFDWGAGRVAGIGPQCGQPRVASCPRLVDSAGNTDELESLSYVTPSPTLNIPDIMPDAVDACSEYSLLLKPASPRPPIAATTSTAHRHHHHNNKTPWDDSPESSTETDSCHPSPQKPLLRTQRSRSHPGPLPVLSRVDSLDERSLDVPPAEYHPHVHDSLYLPVEHEDGVEEGGCTHDDEGSSTTICDSEEGEASSMDSSHREWRRKQRDLLAQALAAAQWQRFARRSMPIPRTASSGSQRGGLEGEGVRESGTEMHRVGSLPVMGRGVWGPLGSSGEQSGGSTRKAGSATWNDKWDLRAGGGEGAAVAAALTVERLQTAQAAAAAGDTGAPRMQQWLQDALSSTTGGVMADSCEAQAVAGGVGITQLGFGARLWRLPAAVRARLRRALRQTGSGLLRAHASVQGLGLGSLSLAKVVYTKLMMSMFRGCVTRRKAVEMVVGSNNGPKPMGTTASVQTSPAPCIPHGRTVPSGGVRKPVSRPNLPISRPSPQFVAAAAAMAGCSTGQPWRPPRVSAAGLRRRGVTPRWTDSSSESSSSSSAKETDLDSLMSIYAISSHAASSDIPVFAMSDKSTPTHPEVHEEAMVQVTPVVVEPMVVEPVVDKRELLRSCCVFSVTPDQVSHMAGGQADTAPSVPYPCPVPGSPDTDLKRVMHDDHHMHVVAFTVLPGSQVEAASCTPAPCTLHVLQGSVQVTLSDPQAALPLPTTPANPTNPTTNHLATADPQAGCPAAATGSAAGQASCTLAPITSMDALPLSAVMDEEWVVVEGDVEDLENLDTCAQVQAVVDSLVTAVVTSFMFDQDHDSGQNHDGGQDDGDEARRVCGAEVVSGLMEQQPAVVEAGTHATVVAEGVVMVLLLCDEDQDDHMCVVLMVVEGHHESACDVLGRHQDDGQYTDVDDGDVPSPTLTPAPAPAPAPPPVESPDEADQFISGAMQVGMIESAAVVLMPEPQAVEETSQILDLGLQPDMAAPQTLSPAPEPTQEVDLVPEPTQAVDLVPEPMDTPAHLTEPVVSDTVPESVVDTDASEMSLYRTLHVQQGSIVSVAPGVRVTLSNTPTLDAPGTGVQGGACPGVVMLVMIKAHANMCHA